MNNRMKHWFASLIMVVVFPGLVRAGLLQSTNVGDEIQVIKAAAVLKDKHPERDFLGGEQIPFPERFECSVSLEEVLAEKKYEIQLEVINPTDLDFPFDQIQTGCLCSKGEFEGKVFSRGTKSIGKIHMRIPSSLALTSLRLEFTHKNLDGSRSLSGYIDISFKIAGHLGFRQNQYELRTTTGTGSWSFPFTFTAPIQPESLKADCSNELRDAQLVFGEFDKNAGTGVLVMTLPETMIDDSGIHGAVTLADSLTGNKATVNLVLLKSKPYSFSPLVLRLRQSEHDGKTLVANAILNVARLAKEDSAKIAALPNVSLTCVYDGQPVEIEATKIGGSIYRLVISVREQALIEGLDKLRFALKIDGESFQLEVPFLR